MLAGGGRSCQASPGPTPQVNSSLLGLRVLAVTLLVTDV